MELIVQNETIKLNQQPTAESIINTINNLIHNNCFFSHLIVDGVEVYEDLGIYLSENILQIKKLEVIVKTVNEFVNDLLLLLKDYLENASKEIVILSEEFYQNPTKESWSKFSLMLEGFQWLNQVIISIDSSEKHPINWEEYIMLAAKLQIELKNLEEALENNDTILIADLMQYEILPIYDLLKTEIQKSIDTEGYYNDIN